MDQKEGRRFSGDRSGWGMVLTEKTWEGLTGLAWTSHKQWHRGHSDTDHLEPAGKTPRVEDHEACHLQHEKGQTQ